MSQAHATNRLIRVARRLVLARRWTQTLSSVVCVMLAVAAVREAWLHETGVALIIICTQINVTLSMWRTHDEVVKLSELIAGLIGLKRTHS